MTLLARAAAFVSIKPGEGRSVALMVLHSFAMGTSTVFFETAASALFLARFPSSAIPWVYLVAAAVNALVGLTYARLQERLSFRGLMVSTLGLLLVGVTGLRLGLLVSQTALVVFALLVFYRVVSALTDLEYWALATRLYDVRQAKRLFGVVGSGEVVARMAGAFSVPLLVRRMGVSNLLVLSALGLLACLVLLLLVLSLVEDSRAPRSRTDAGRPERRRGLLLGPYMKVMLFMVFAGVLGKYFVDYAFLAELKAHSGDAERLASFFGVFSGATQAASLLTRLLVSGPLLSRFGVRTGLIVLPGIHLIVTSAIAVASFLGGQPQVFWLVIMNQAAYKTLKHPIDNPSLKVLYQPLRKEDRLQAQIAVETVVTPLAVGFAGLCLLAFDAVGPYSAGRFSAVMAPVFVVWLALAGRAGRSYASALLDALKGRLADAESLTLADEKTLGVVRQVLKGGSPSDVVFSLELLDHAGAEWGDELLMELLRHPSGKVRRAAVLRLEKRAPQEALEAVLLLAGSDEDPRVRAAALTSLAAFKDSSADAALAKALRERDEVVRQGALVGLLRREA